MVVFETPPIKKVLNVIDESYEDVFGEDTDPDLLECIKERLRPLYKDVIKQNVRFAGCDINQLPQGVYAVECTGDMNEEEMFELKEKLQDFVDMAGDGYHFLIISPTFFLKKVPDDMTEEEIKRLKE